MSSGEYAITRFSRWRQYWKNHEIRTS